MSGPFHLSVIICHHAGIEKESMPAQNIYFLTTSIR